MAGIVPVPEASLNLNGGMMPWKHDIRSAGQSRTMQAKS